MAYVSDEKPNFRLVARAYDTFKEPFRSEFARPAWSLSALMALLAKCELKATVERLNIYTFFDSLYGILYWSFDFINEFTGKFLRGTDPDPVEAALQLIEKLHVRNLI